MNIFYIEYRVVLHDDQNEVPFCNRMNRIHRRDYVIDNDVQDVLRRQNILSFQVEIQDSEFETLVNRTLSKFAIRPGPVSGGRSGNRCRLVYRKPFLMRNLSQGTIILLALQVRFILTKRCV